MERRRLLIADENKKKAESSTEKHGKRTYILKDGEIKLGSISNSNSNYFKSSYSNQKVLKDGMIYVNGEEKEYGSSAQTYAFPADKGWDEQSVAAWYQKQGYNITAEDIGKGEVDGKTSYAPSSKAIDATFVYEGTYIVGSVTLGNYELEKYKYIGFTIFESRGSGDFIINAKKVLGKAEKVLGKITKGENRFELPDPAQDEKKYETITFKPSSTGNPVYKISEIYLEE